MTKVTVNANRNNCVSINNSRQGSGANVFIGYWDASGGKLPSLSKKGYNWIIGDGVNEDTGGGFIPYLGGSIYLAPRSRITANIDDAGQNWFNWSNT